MAWIRVVLSRCASLFLRRRLDAELDDELDSHLEMAAEENRLRGMNAEEARRKAMRDFGGVTQIRETVRVREGVLWIENLRRDVAYALRQIVRAPGVMAYSVARRTREIGVRLALGAQRTAVLTMVLRQATVLVGVGMAIGLAASLAWAPLLHSMLYGAGSRNPLVLAGVCLVVALTGITAASLPAMRAASIDPMRALRNE